MNIRTSQTSSVDRMLSSVVNSTSPWKVLIYDRFSRDLLKIKQREHNITLRMLIDSPRERIPDVSAVYVVLPTEENVRLIAKDAAGGVYDSIHVHFTSPSSREVLELLAREIATRGGALAIAKVWDQFLGFVALEKQLFTLNSKDSFQAYNSISTTDERVMKALNHFAGGLTDALVVLGRVPVIRCERNGAAKELAEIITHKVFALLKDRLAFQIEQTTVEPRPILLILDRGSDMCTPLQHTDGYKTLVDDLLGPIRLNRVEVVMKEDGLTNGKKQLFELDPEVDSFWAKMGDVAFPDAIKEQTEGVKEVDEKARRMGVNSVGSSMMPGDEDSASNALMDAVNALPELTERKRTLAMHGQLMRAAFEEIQKRAIPKYYEIESRMVGKQATRGERKVVMEMLGDSSKLSEDRVRLLVLYALNAKASSQEFEDLEKILLANIANEDPLLAKQSLAYVRRVLSVMNGASTSASIASSDRNAFLSNVDWQAAFSGLQEKLQLVANSVTGSGSWGPAAKAVEAVCGGAGGGASTDVSAEIDQQYMYYDPKIGTTAVPSSGSRFRGKFERCIVFVVGGGCYTEYHNLCQYATQRKKEIVYGATEMMNPAEFLRQMKESA